MATTIEFLFIEEGSYVANFLIRLLATDVVGLPFPHASGLLWKQEICVACSGEVGER